MWISKFEFNKIKNSLEFERRENNRLNLQNQKLRERIESLIEQNNYLRKKIYLDK